MGDVLLLRNLRNLCPQDLRKIHSVAEGFYWFRLEYGFRYAASGLWNLTQIIGIASIDGVNRLTGGPNSRVDEALGLARDGR